MNISGVYKLKHKGSGEILYGMLCEGGFTVSGSCRTYSLGEVDVISEMLSDCIERVVGDTFLEMMKLEV